MPFTLAELTFIGMIGTFLVTFAVFIWWLSSKFFGLRISIDKGFSAVSENMNILHKQNVERFHNLEKRIIVLEQHRQHRG